MTTDPRNPLRDLQVDLAGSFEAWNPLSNQAELLDCAVNLAVGQKARQARAYDRLLDSVIDGRSPKQRDKLLREWVRRNRTLLSGLPKDVRTKLDRQFTRAENASKVLVNRSAALQRTQAAVRNFRRWAKAPAAAGRVSWYLEVGALVKQAIYQGVLGVPDGCEIIKRHAQGWFTLVLADLRLSLVGGKVTVRHALFPRGRGPLPDVCDVNMYVRYTPPGPRAILQQWAAAIPGFGDGDPDKALADKVSTFLGDTGINMLRATSLRQLRRYEDRVINGPRRYDRLIERQVTARRATPNARRKAEFTKEIVRLRKERRQARRYATYGKAVRAIRMLSAVVDVYTKIGKFAGVVPVSSVPVSLGKDDCEAARPTAPPGGGLAGTAPSTPAPSAPVPPTTVMPPTEPPPTTPPTSVDAPLAASVGAWAGTAPLGVSDQGVVFAMRVEHSPSGSTVTTVYGRPEIDNDVHVIPVAADEAVNSVVDISDDGSHALLEVFKNTPFAGRFYLKLLDLQDGTVTTIEEGAEPIGVLDATGQTALDRISPRQPDGGYRIPRIVHRRLDGTPGDVLVSDADYGKRPLALSGDGNVAVYRDGEAYSGTVWARSFGTSGQPIGQGGGGLNGVLGGNPLSYTGDKLVVTGLEGWDDPNGAGGAGGFLGLTGERTFAPFGEEPLVTTRDRISRDGLRVLHGTSHPVLVRNRLTGATVDLSNYRGGTPAPGSTAEDGGPHTPRFVSDGLRRALLVGEGGKWVLASSEP